MGTYQCPPHKSGKNQIIRRIGRMNAHRPCCGGGGCRALRDGGWGLSPEALAKGDTSNYHHCHCEGVRTTLKTLAYDCGNPVLICLRANARSAFLFTGSPRSFHSLAMTKGSNSPSTHHSCHSRARGPHKYECICGVVKAGIGLGLLLVI